jgi:polyferredoxin
MRVVAGTLASTLADAVLVVHVGVAAFVVLGLVVTLVGNAKGWRWVNDLRFRAAHLAAIAVVAAEAWLGVVCPLTTLEMWLRSQAGAPTYAGGFVEHWLQRLLYYDAPPWVFVAGYSAFAAIVIATWLYFPPRRRQGASSATS